MNEYFFPILNGNARSEEWSKLATRAGQRGSGGTASRSGASLIVNNTQGVSVVEG